MLGNHVYYQDDQHRRFSISSFVAIITYEIIITKNIHTNSSTVDAAESPNEPTTLFCL